MRPPFTGARIQSFACANLSSSPSSTGQASAHIPHLSVSHRPVFLLNSCLSLFSAAHLKWAPLLPKLRGHFAEFLSNASSVSLRILSSSTCVGLRYGHVSLYSGFSRRLLHALRYSLFAPRHGLSLYSGFSSCTDTPLGPGSIPGSRFLSVSPQF